ncbi:potassium channel family protein [Methanosalsum natronophilum]|nr:potassium channel family protein [Methanosalsum natronophilum]MCS3924163.1 uncharacterized protein with PhoU and TrkA domain [Methanosalsum natronophilum]
MNSKEIKYTPHNLKDLLTELKDTSELMVDLAYSAMMYDDIDIAEEVLRLEEKVDVFDYHMKIVAMLSARKVEVAEAMVSALTVSESAADISNAAVDIAKIVTLNMNIPYELNIALRDAEETFIRVKVNEDSIMNGQTLKDIELDIEAGMWITAIRRQNEWIYNPGHDTRILKNDVLFARGHGEGVPLFSEMASNEKPIPRNMMHTNKLADLEMAVDIIVEMKNIAELSVGLAYSALLFDNEDIAYEVKSIESQMEIMKSNLEHWVLKTAKHVKDVNQLRGLLHLGNASLKISNAAYGIADTVIRDIELHPVITLAIRNSDEIISKLKVEECSSLVGRSLSELKIETETGMYILAVKKGNKWIYRPSSKTIIHADDLLIAKGSRIGEQVFFDLCSCPIKSKKCG